MPSIRAELPGHMMYGERLKQKPIPSEPLYVRPHGNALPIHEVILNLRSAGLSVPEITRKLASETRSKGAIFNMCFELARIGVLQPLKDDMKTQNRKVIPIDQTTLPQSRKKRTASAEELADRSAETEAIA